MGDPLYFQKKIIFNLCDILKAYAIFGRVRESTKYNTNENVSFEITRFLKTLKSTKSSVTAEIKTQWNKNHYGLIVYSVVLLFILSHLDFKGLLSFKGPFHVAKGRRGGCKNVHPYPLEGRGGQNLGTNFSPNE